VSQQQLQILRNRIASHMHTRPANLGPLTLICVLLPVLAVHCQAYPCTGNLYLLGASYPCVLTCSYAAADSVQALPLVSTIWGVVLFGEYYR